MIQAILKRIEAARRIVVASHESPDGDAFGSTLALTLGLRAMGKEVVAFNRDGIFPPFDFLPGSDTLTSNLTDVDRFDLGFVLDAGELRRAGGDLVNRCDALINVDHHPHSEEFGVVNYVDTTAAATGLMVYRILAASGITIDHDMAVCIYSAIISDTGSFHYSNANPEAFQVAGEMIAKGVGPWDVAGALYESHDPRRMKLLARVLPTLEIAPNGRYASLWVDDSMFAETGACSEDTDGFINYARSIRGVEVALFLRQVGPTRYKTSFRSKGLVDVGKISRDLGGGGHHNAAGATLDGDLVAIKEQLRTILDRHLAG